MKTQEQCKKKEEKNSSETRRERDRQVRETIDQFLKTTSEKGEAVRIAVVAEVGAGAVG